MGYSRYGSSGKGLSDRGTRRYASGLSGSSRKSYVTFLNDAGRLIAIGSFQAIGHTAATLGYGGESLRTAPVTHKWSIGAGSGKGTYNIFRDGLIFTGGSVTERKEMIDATIAGKAYVPSQRGIGSKESELRGTPFGAIIIGRGKGRYPPWVMQMLGKSALGKPPKSEGSPALPIGLALVAMKVLL